jgi:hypothetical protein
LELKSTVISSTDLYLSRFFLSQTRCRAISSAVPILEEEEEVFGNNPWAHGLTPENQVVLEKFVQYAHEQGFIPYQPKLSDLFAPVSR